MPNHEEHCQSSLKKYGVRADDIHTFLDQPSSMFGSEHREFRHDSDTVKLVGDMFGPKYGREVAENVALDHIMLDHEQEIQRRDETEALKCPNCGAPVEKSTTGKTVCKYCGFEIVGSLVDLKIPRHGFILRYRNKGDGLPQELPPIEMHREPRVIDGIYESFPDKEEVQFLLDALGYASVTLESLLATGLTEEEITALVMNAKTVTTAQIKEVLDQGRTVTTEEDFEDQKRRRATDEEERAQNAKKLWEYGLLLWPILSVVGYVVGGLVAAAILAVSLGLAQYLLYLHYKTAKLHVEKIDETSSPYAVEVEEKR